MDLSGATTMHGPVSATFQAPTAVELMEITAEPAAPASLPWWGVGLVLLAGLAATGTGLGLARRKREVVVQVD